MFFYKRKSLHLDPGPTGGGVSFNSKFGVSSQPANPPANQPANQPTSQPASRQEAGGAKNSKNDMEKCVNGHAGPAPRCMRALVVNEIVASEAPERPTSSKKRHEAGRAKNSKNELEKCVNGREGRAPRCMGAFLVNEIVASETPERSMSLKCVPVKRESNTQASGIEPLIGEN